MNRKRTWVYPLLIALIILAAVIIIFFLVRPYFTGELQVNEVVFQIGDIAVRWYGLLIALSFIPGIYTAVWMAKNWGINPDHIYNFAILAAPLGLIFARLFYCALNWGVYSRMPLRILYIWEGGLSLYGVLFGGILAALIYAYASKIPFLRMLDLGAPPLLLGQAIGRWGNFFNQELFGYPTDLPWKMYVRPEKVQALSGHLQAFDPSVRDSVLSSSYFHPTFLYESIANLILFGVLVWIANKKDLRPGVIISIYMIGYGTYRFFEEFVRIEPVSVWFMSWGQVASLVTVIAGALILFYVQRRKPKAKAVTPEGIVLEVPIAEPAAKLPSPVQPVPTLVGEQPKAIAEEKPAATSGELASAASRRRLLRRKRSRAIRNRKLVPQPKSLERRQLKPKKAGFGRKLRERS